LCVGHYETTPGQFSPVSAAVVERGAATLEGRYTFVLATRRCELEQPGRCSSRPEPVMHSTPGPIRKLSVDRHARWPRGFLRGASATCCPSVG